MDSWLVIIQYEDSNGNPYFAPLRYPDSWDHRAVLVEVRKFAENLKPGWRFSRLNLWQPIPEPVKVIGYGELVAHTQLTTERNQ